MFWYFLGAVIAGCIFGAITHIIIADKGYEENWFWWGFFFGIIAVVIALLRQPYRHPIQDDDFFERIVLNDRGDVPENGWKCGKCGRGNQHYTGTCACGNSKYTNR